MILVTSISLHPWWGLTYSNWNGSNVGRANYVASIRCGNAQMSTEFCHCRQTKLVICLRRDFGRSGQVLDFPALYLAPAGMHSGGHLYGQDSELGQCFMIYMQDQASEVVLFRACRPAGGSPQPRQPLRVLKAHHIQSRGRADHEEAQGGCHSILL